MDAYYRWQIMVILASAAAVTKTACIPPAQVAPDTPAASVVT